MIEEEKLAKIHKELIEPAQEGNKNIDIIIKIRDGTIVWAETNSIIKVSVNFKL